MATPRDFAKAFLSAAGLPVTDNNVKALIAWQSGEGGHWINSLTFNPLNTSWAMDGNTTNALRPYSSWAVGLHATVKTLLVNHPYIAAKLRADKPAAETLLAISNEPVPVNQRWGTTQFNPTTIPGYLAPSNIDTYGAKPDAAGTVLSTVEDLAAGGAKSNVPESLLKLYNRIHDAAGAVAKVGAQPPPNISTWGDQPAWPEVAEAYSRLLKALGGIWVSGKNQAEAQAMLDAKPPQDLADRAKRVLEWVRDYEEQQRQTPPTLSDLPDPFGPGVPAIKMPNDLSDPFVTLTPQSRDRALVALRDQGGGPGGRGESGPPVFPGANPFGIPIGRSSRFPDFGGGRKMPGGGRPGDNPFTAPGPKPFAPVHGLTPPRNPTSSAGRRPDTGPNPAPPKSTGGGMTAPNPPAERSTDPKGAALEGRSDPKPVTETKTVTPSPATDAKAPPPSTDTSSGSGNSGSGGTTTDSKDDKKSKDGTKDSTLRRPIWPGGTGMPNPEDDGSGTGGPRANPNPENSGGGLRGASVMRIASRNGIDTRERDFSGGDDDGDLGGVGDRVFDPKLFRFRVPGALGDMPSDQNPNPEDQGRGGGGGGPRAYGSTDRSSLVGPRSYDAYPDPETTGAGGPRGRYNERPNPEDTAGPRGPNARNRNAIGPWSASRNRMI